jgi:hypothetical protein
MRAAKNIIAHIKAAIKFRRDVRYWMSKGYSTKAAKALAEVTL